MKRMNLIGFCVLLIICALPFVFAEIDDSADSESFESFTEKLRLEIEGYEGDTLPSAMSPFIRDESLQIQLTLDSGEAIVFVFVVENGVIVESGEGELENPGFSFEIGQEYVEAHQGESFGRLLRNGLAAGEVRHEVDGFWRKVKLSTMLLAMDVAALFQ